jgi:hypothetical protein
VENARCGADEEQEMKHKLIGPCAVVPPALPGRELAEGEEDGAALFLVVECVGGWLGVLGDGRASERRV